jgi:plastocyanin
MARTRQRQIRSRNALSYLAAGLLVAGTSPPAGGPTPPQRHVVEIRGMAFQPEVLELALGDTVVWINRDIVPHTATAEGSDAWDTGILASGDSARYVPLVAGAATYVCRLHPTMRARLVIGPQPGRRTRAGIAGSRAWSHGAASSSPSRLSRHPAAAHP